MPKTLSSDEIDTYVQQIVIPSYKPFLTKKLKMAIWKLDGTLAIATNAWADVLGFNSYEEILSSPLKNLLQELSICDNLDKLTNVVPRLEEISLKKELTPEKKIASLDVLKRIISLRLRAIEQEMLIEAILVHPFQNVHKSAILFRFIPIFHPTGQLIAIQALLSDFSMLGIMDYLAGYKQQKLEMPTVIKDTASLPVKLSPRQHEMLFLLVIGLSQTQISELLDISRGTIAKTISHIICPKFNINPPNSAVLINKARKLKIHRSIPPTLCKPWMIILNEDDDIVG